MNILREFLCRLFAPGYQARMPDDALGAYLAIAYTGTPCGLVRWQDACRVVGRRNAYKVARWLALRAGCEWRVIEIASLTEGTP